MNRQKVVTLPPSGDNWTEYQKAKGYILITHDGDTLFYTYRAEDLEWSSISMMHMAAEIVIESIRSEFHGESI